MKNIIITAFILLICNLAFADGIIVADNDEYPGRILKNKSTSIEVNIEGLLAKTITIQEFQNEWDETVNGVYSFPVPLNARVTRLMYSKADTLIDAVLREIPQSTNPGTGEGGLVAEINQYMGQNVVTLKLTNIHPNIIKWVRLEYVMELNHFQGEVSYKYPLNTEGFYSTPLDYLSVNVNISSNQEITSFEMPSNPDYVTIQSDNHTHKVLMVKPNAYQASDVEFKYTVSNPNFLMDFYSIKTEAADGYFTMIGRPLLNPVDNVFPTNMIFLVENSSTMIGEKINQSKLAVIEALDELNPADSFNVASFNYYPNFWQTGPVDASPANIEAAKEFVQNISPSGGSHIENSIVQCLQQLENSRSPSSVIVFTDGHGYVNPYDVEEDNSNNTAIVFVSFTDRVDRHRLETTAMLNYGFVTYLNEGSILGEEMVRIFKKIHRPLIKDVQISFSSGDVYDLYPEKLPAVYADSDFKITGRYQSAGDAVLTLTGEDPSGGYSTNFNVNFDDGTSGNDISRNMWVKDVILDRESEILIFGETDLLKDELVDLSLSEKMRCRYTAYVEDSTYMNFTDSLFTGGSDDPTSLVSSLSDELDLNIFPNPVFENLNIQIDLSLFPVNASKVLKIYDATGRLVYTHDFSDYQSELYTKSISKHELDTQSKILIVCFEVNNEICYSKSVVIAE